MDIKTTTHMVYRILKQRRLCGTLTGFSRDWLCHTRWYYHQCGKTPQKSAILNLYFRLVDEKQVDLADKVFALLGEMVRAEFPAKPVAPAEDGWDTEGWDVIAWDVA